MKEKLAQKTQFRSRDRWLLFSFILGPTAWMLHLTLSYALVPESCARGHKLFLHLVTAVCLAGALAAAGMAWRIRQACMTDPGSEAWKERTRWTATVALITSLAMALVILAEEIPNLILRSCD